MSAYVSGEGAPYVLAGEGVHHGLEVDVAPNEGAWAVKDILRFEMDDICGTEHRISVRTRGEGRWAVSAVCLGVERGAVKTEGELAAADPVQAKALKDDYLRFIRGEARDG